MLPQPKLSGAVDSFIYSISKFSIIRNDIIKRTFDTNVKNLQKLPDAIKDTLKLETEIQLIAKEFLDAKGSMFLGRGNSFQ